MPLKVIQEGLRTQEVPAASTLQVWFPAEAAGDESARALLTAPVSGIIASAPAAPGRPLAKGAVLLTLRSPELAELKSRWLSAQARLKRAQADLGLAELGRRLGDQVGGEHGQLEAAAEAVAADRGDDRQIARDQSADGAVEAGQHAGGVGPGVLGHRRADRG